MTTTRKQNRLGKIVNSLSKTGIVRDDLRKISKYIDNMAIHKLNADYIQDILDQTIFVNAQKCALRRTFDNNVVIYGPKGYAVVEYRDVLYVHEYGQEEIKTTFEKMTKNFSDFVSYNDNSPVFASGEQPTIKKVA